MLLIYDKEQVLNQAEREKCYAEFTQLCHDLESRGQFVSASPLQSIDMATSVRVRDGKPLITYLEAFRPRARKNV